MFFNTPDGQTIAVDAATGQELWRTKLGEINKGETMTMAPLVVKGKVLVGNKGVDLKTGRLTVNEEKLPVLGKVIRDVCPAAPGAKDWNPAAFSPRTGLLYLPHLNLCMDWESVEVHYIAGTPYVGANVRMYAGPGGHRGEVTAWDPIQRKAVWKIDEDLPVWSGALATAGDLVFYGTMEGRFKAVDARSSEVLWQFKTASGIIGQPISYRHPDGRQHVAVLSGVNAHHVSEGKRLFEWFNCSGCHLHGSVGIGPPLMDDRWIYGSQLENIYATIV